jgi:phosphopantothenoylcysteine decarboxylase/phosphopantothenate--cysteine ligase
MSEPFAGKKILLGVTGGIAAYKSVFLLRLLKSRGAEVKVVMTEAATEFVTPLTFESLSENPVHRHMFGAQSEGATSPIEHIDLAKWPDLAVVAPATANTLAKLASGAADDLLTSILAAFDGTTILAPAMNDVMWQNAATQANLRQLSQLGYRVVSPGKGALACGYEAEGRMAEPEDIVAAVDTLLDSPFAKLRVLVSVGATEEDIDAVRVITNRSSGKMGFALAEAARIRGAQVTAVVGRVSVPAPQGIRTVSVRTGAEMSQALKKEFVDADVLIMAAAVSDYKAAKPIAGKEKKRDTWTVELEHTEDILHSLGAMKGKRFIVGFALETDDAEAHARDKLAKKNCDLMVMNNPREEGAAFEHDTNAVTIYNASGELARSELQSKRDIADFILTTAEGQTAFQETLRNTTAR